MNKWDKYYLSVVKTVAENSSCFSRKIGAILVRDKSILATGYNGPPRGIPHCDTRLYDYPYVHDFVSKRRREFYSGKCPRQILGYKSGEGLHLCPAVHAEVNCLINAAREGVITKGCDMYLSCPIPCKDCMAAIINAGIKTVTVIEYKFYDELSRWLLEKSNLKVRVYGDEESLSSM